MQLAIVILNWNGKDLLEKFLPSIITYSPKENATIYVADNASTDDSVSFITSTFPEVKIIQNSQNLGFAGGYNEALKHIKADVYALVNSDIEVTPNWCDSLLKHFDQKQVVAAQPKIKAFNNKSHFEYAGAAGGFIDAYGFAYCKGRLFDTVEEDLGQYEISTDIFWGSGACLFIRSESFWEIGGFDKDFFAHQEEIDLCWRLHNLGHKIVYEPNSTVYHVGGATLSVGSPQKTYLNFRNSLWMLTKNLPKKKLLPRLFIRLSLDGIAAFKFLTQLQPKHFWAVFRAHIAFYGKLNHNLNKRQAAQIQNYFNTKNIVIQYFLKKKKNYKDLKHV